MKYRPFIICALLVFIAYGLICGLLYSVNLELSSDHIVPGLVAMEIFKHGNFQYAFPAEDPYLFTDVYSFYLIPQALTGFSPLVLRLTGYFVFLLTLVTFTYLVYRYGGLISALIFAALLTTVTQSAYFFFLSPEYHVGTLLATGVLILLFDPDAVKDLSSRRLAASLVLLCLIVLSDNLILAYFVIPYVVYYLAFVRLRKPAETGKASKKAIAEKSAQTKKMDSLIIFMLVSSAVVYLYKKFQPMILTDILPRFLHKQEPLLSLDPGAIASRVSLYLQSITTLVSKDLFNVLSGQATIPAIVFGLLFLLVLGYSITRLNLKAAYLNVMLLSSFGIMLIAYLFTTYAIDLVGTRFLILCAVTIFVVIALAFDEKRETRSTDLVYLAAIGLILIATVPAAYSSISALTYQPDEDRYEVIQYLRDNNVTFGYSDYENSNLLTYMSNEQVTLRLIKYNGDGFSENVWLSSDRWWSQGIPDQYAVVISRDGELYPHLASYTESYPPSDTLYFKNYTILKYDLAE